MSRPAEHPTALGVSGPWLRAILFSIVMVPILAVVVAVACDSRSSAHEDEIRANLPPGSTVEEINGFLSSIGLGPTGEVLRVGDYSRLYETGYPHSTNIVVELVRDTGGWFLSQEDTFIFFILDDDLRLVEIIFSKGYTSL